MTVANQALKVDAPGYKSFGNYDTPALIKTSWSQKICPATQLGVHPKPITRDTSEYHRTRRQNLPAGATALHRVYTTHFAVNLRKTGENAAHAACCALQTNSSADMRSRNASASLKTVVLRSSSIRSHVRYILPIRALLEKRSR